MPKKILQTGYTTNTHEKRYSYFMDKIFPSLLTAALAAGFALVAMYFTVNTLSTRVGALETGSARKDVIEKELEPIKEDIKEVKQDVKDIKAFLLGEKD